MKDPKTRPLVSAINRAYSLTLESRSIEREKEEREKHRKRPFFGNDDVATPG